VTIIAGFRSDEGIVLCSDTQETIGSSKRHVAKVKVVPEHAELLELLGNGDLAAVFGGSGYGPFIDLLTRKAWESCANSTSLEDACSAIEASIKSVYREYGEIYQHGQCPTVELIYGVKLGGQSRLFSCVGPIVNPVDRYCSAGAGYYMSDFLSARMYSDTISIQQCVILAAYILFQTKEHVDGCGGDSQVAVLRHNGRSGMVNRHRINALTELLKESDRRLGQVLLAAANLQPDYGTVLDMSLEVAKDAINHARETALVRIAIDENPVGTMLPGFNLRDDLGFLELGISNPPESTP